VREKIFEFRSEETPREYLLVEGTKDGAAVFTVRSLGGGFASIDVPVEDLADLGRRLLARAAAFV
jgi:uridine phosphorylase